MTVAALSQEMPHAELCEWLALDQIRVAEHEKAQRLAKKGMRSR